MNVGSVFILCRINQQIVLLNIQIIWCFVLKRILPGELYEELTFHILNMNLPVNKQDVETPLPSLEQLVLV